VSFITRAVLVAGAHVAFTWAAAAFRGRSARSRADAARLPRNPPPLVSVIVPAWDERYTIERCVRSLTAVEYRPFETIVVAGGGDGTYDAASRAAAALPDSRVLRQGPLGKNAALNIGLRATRGEIVVFLDADCEVTPGWLGALVAPIDGRIVATTGRATPFETSFVSGCEEMDSLWSRRVAGTATLNGSGSIAITRTALEGIGGLPEGVTVGVDWDLDVRLARAGLARVFCSDATVRTDRPATLAEYWSNEVRWRRAHLTSLVRHADYFLATPGRAMASLYVYMLSWAVAASSLLLPVVLARGPRRTRGLALGLWLVGLGWVGLRRVSLPIGVAAYTGDPHWLRLAWAPPLLLGLTIAASVRATVTLGQTSAHFKGPRRARETRHAG
jgi:cellulose synthase/poly-beta-1,6-N-acetylglucosamine synthase-like glycosyltransferase